MSLKAANVEVEPYRSGLFARALEGVNVKDSITAIGSGAGTAPVVAASACESAVPAAEAKKDEEPKVSERALISSFNGQLFLFIGACYERSASFGGGFLVKFMHIVVHMTKIYFSRTCKFRFLIILSLNFVSFLI